RPLLTVEEDWPEIFRMSNHQALEQALQNWLPSRRWFRGQARAIKSVRVQEIFAVPANTEQIFLTFLHVEYVEAEPESYLLPLACAFGEQADGICRDWPALVVARLALNSPNKDGVLHDAIANKAFCQALLKLISSRRTVAGNSGQLEAAPTALLRQLRNAGALALESSLGDAEDCHSSILYGDQLILKLFRRLGGTGNL